MYRPGEVGQISGWGLDEFYNKSSYSEVLQYASLEMDSFQTCSRAYRKQEINRDTQYCAGIFKGLAHKIRKISNFTLQNSELRNWISEFWTPNSEIPRFGFRKSDFGVRNVKSLNILGLKKNSRMLLEKGAFRSKTKIPIFKMARRGGGEFKALPPDEFLLPFFHIDVPICFNLFVVWTKKVILFQGSLYLFRNPFLKVKKCIIFSLFISFRSIVFWMYEAKKEEVKFVIQLVEIFKNFFLAEEKSRKIMFYHLWY